MVQDVCFFLESLCVKIEGIGTTTLTVHGVKSINTPITYFPSEDPTESMFFLAVAATTNSSIRINRCPIDFLELELLKMSKMGFKYKILRKYKANNGQTNLVDIMTAPSKLKALEEKIHPSSYPGLNIDNLPFFAVIATQAKGQTLIHDWIYEKRAIYYTELDKLGADTILADQHRIFINGPTPLRAAQIVCPPALRPATIILIGMLAAKGTSMLRNVYSINRGYEDLANRLNLLGANIKTFQEI
jgi:UDP-N-acetylglucosamine 1-carboxyvinyltransferase